MDVEIPSLLLLGLGPAGRPAAQILPKVRLASYRRHGALAAGSPARTGTTPRRWTEASPAHLIGTPPELLTQPMTGATKVSVIALRVGMSAIGMTAPFASTTSSSTRAPRRGDGAHNDEYAVGGTRCGSTSGREVPVAAASGSRFTPARLRAAGVEPGGIDGLVERANRVANLQLLEGAENVDKRAMLPAAWMADAYPDSDAGPATSAATTWEWRPTT